MHPLQLSHDLYLCFTDLTNLYCEFMSRCLVMLCFSGTIRARAMKLSTSIHLVEGS